jgi:CheY-like chemotaxis protein
MKKRILVVDDDNNTRELLKNFFKHYGYEVFTAENGEKAILFLQCENVHSIITDYRMPVMNGIDFTIWVKRNRPGIPVVLVTGDNIEEIFIRGNPPTPNEMPDVVVTKPFQVGIISEIVKNLLK